MSTHDQLALLGGTPIVDRAQWPTWPPRNPDFLKALQAVLEEDQWGINSAGIARFEQAFAQRHDANYGLAMANGTVALYAALLAIDIKPGDEVIVPAYTFMATAAVVTHAGATPVFADVDARTYNLDPADCESKITPRTRAIMPVHVGGNPADMQAFIALGQKHGLTIIEDAAQAPGAIYDGKGVGALGDMGCFSFQSSKNITAGEGGILLTNSETLYRRLFQIYNCGRVLGGMWYEHAEAGLNLRISTFQAALLEAQLEYLEEWAVKRETNGVYLEGRLNAVPGIQCAGRYDLTGRNAYHLLIFTFDTAEFGGISKARFLEAMLAEGVVATDGYGALYEMDFFPNPPEPLPVTEDICARGVWIRQFELLADQGMMDQIVAAVEKVRAQAHLL